MSELASRLDRLEALVHAQQEELRSTRRSLTRWRGAALAVLVLTTLLAPPLARYAGAVDTEAVQSDAKRLKALEQAVFGRSPVPVGTADRITTLGGTVATQGTLLNVLADKLTHFSRVGNEVYITGANLHIISGSGATEGAENGLGNIIVGYNETRNDGTDVRTGSHNLVLGLQNNYVKHGGLVAGQFNTISGNMAVVTGGSGNTASGDYSAVGAGSGNTASGRHSTVSAGYQNVATATASTVSGGSHRQVNGLEDWQGGSFFSDN